MRSLETEADLAAAIADLLVREPRFAPVVESHGIPPLRRSEAGLTGLYRIITDQLISLQAGQAIWRRVEAELNPFEAGRISRMHVESLMKLGLSGAKARCFKSVARAVVEGSFSFESLDTLSDAEALEALTALTGIGPWTADIYLLSAMGRADAWPGGDLALQSAAQHLFALEKRPDAKALYALAEPWRPWRSVAARLLWSHYRGLKGMSQQVV